MTKSEVIEALYNRLPDKEADNLIDMILTGNDDISLAVSYLNREKNSDSFSYNLFSSIENKPIYKTVTKFMEGELTDSVQILKMLSSVLTQIFIQCELRNLNPASFDLATLTNLIIKISPTTEVDNEVTSEIKLAMKQLGYSSCSE